jgi:hypothetical protein
MLTIAIEAFASALVVAGFVLVRQPGGLGIGACGAILWGAALSGIFQ